MLTKHRTNQGEIMKKHVKVLGLAVVAALALTAFVGTSGAAAKAHVCSTSGTGAACAGSHGFEYTTEALSASTGAGVATLTSGFARVECPSTMTGSITHGGSGTITMLNFAVASCKSTLGACTVAKATGLPWAATAVTGTAPNGTMEVSSTVGGEFTCGGVNCQYTAPSAGTKGEITIKGGEPAVVTASKVPMSKSGGSAFCSATSEWDGVYTVSTPSSLFLT
jgi:hypothetical protein